MTLEEKFSSLIKEELPGKVGSELKEVLIKAEKDAGDIIMLNKRIQEDTEFLKELRDENSNLKTQLEQHESLDSKLNALEIREKALEVIVLKIQLEEANKRADVINSYTLGLVRNVEFRRNLFDNKQLPEQRDVNGYAFYPNSTQNSQETKTIE
jgi:hypothetical protein